MPVEIQKSAINSYLNKNLSVFKKKIANRPWRPNYTKKSGVKIRIFGDRNRSRLKKSPKKITARGSLDKMKSSVKRNGSPVSSRSPASINKTGFSITEEDDVFEKSLLDAYKKQQRHSKEVNSLINDLKNYRQDYQISH